ncbi:MAG: Uma2 family endonuclease [Chloroflexi bacterium]|nr:Uma2 family endonuclease [Chloroflexota bacterium]
MADAGILHEDDRVELLDGEIVEMPPINSRHASTVERTSRLFHLALGDSAMVRVQQPVVLGRRSEPEPDVAVSPRHRRRRAPGTR